MMEKRNVATERRVKDEDEKELEKEVALFGGLPEKKAEARDPKPAEEDEKSDEDTIR